MSKINWKRNFLILWTGQAISLITSSILQMALIWYLTDTTGSAMILSLATLVGFLPQAIFGPMIGVFIDRYSRKLIMLGSDFIIALAGSILAIITIYLEPPVWIILCVLFVRSLGTAFHSPSLSAITPLLVPEDKLTKCAGYSQAVQSISLIVSPMAAAILYGAISLNKIILIDIIGAILASVSILFISIPKPKTIAQSTKTNFMNELKDGFFTLRKNKGLFTLLWIGSLYLLIYMPVSALFPLMSINYFQGNTTHASIVEISFAVGMLIGGVLLGTWGGFKNRIITIMGSIFIMGFSLSIAGLLPTNAFFLFVFFSGIMGFSGPFYSGVQVALYQEKINPEFLGRVFALYGSLMSLSMPIGLIFSGIFADRIGVNHWFFISGILILLLGVFSCFIPSIRNFDKQ